MTRPFPDLPPYPEVYEGIALGPNQNPPFPGSDEAVAVGCLCDLPEKEHCNKCRIGDYYTIRGDCPLHGVAEARSDVQMRLA